VLLRDAFENVPQPGFVGARYRSTRLLFIAQNPGTHKDPVRDKPYLRALQRLRVEPTMENYDLANRESRKFIPDWTIQKKYFLLDKCHLDLDDIAFFNVVRCRTRDNEKPNEEMTKNCLKEHFKRWLDLLKPRFVVFLGKWAKDQTCDLLDNRRISYVYVNRRRSQSAGERAINQEEVVCAVKKYLKGRVNI
jgi:hypothetical protein